MIREISENFYNITLPMPFRLKHVQVYLLVNEGKAALFDTGFNVGGSYEILETDLGSIGLGIKSISDIYLTHVHADHCGLAGLLKEKTQAAIHLSAAADDSNRNYRQTGLLISRLGEFYLACGLAEKEIAALIGIFKDMRSVISEFRGDDRLQPGEEREFGRWKFKTVFTPGHSNGHTCYYFPDEGILLSGDTILPHITPNLSPDLFDGNFRPLASFLNSIGVLEKLTVDKVYPGHGGPMENIRSRVGELAAHHAERTKLILECLGARPKNALDVSQEIFGGDLPDFDRFLAVNETYVHLLELKDQNRIREERKDGNLVYTLLN